MMWQVFQHQEPAKLKTDTFNEPHADEMLSSNEVFLEQGFILGVMKL